MTPLFTAKCIEPIGGLLVGDEVPVYQIGFDPERNDFWFLVLTKHGFHNFKAIRFTYETKLEKSLK